MTPAQTHARTRDECDWERYELAVGRRLPGRGTGSLLPHLLGRPGGSADRAGQEDLLRMRSAARVPGVRAQPRPDLRHLGRYYRGGPAAGTPPQAARGRHRPAPVRGLATAPP